MRKPLTCAIIERGMCFATTLRDPKPNMLALATRLHMADNIIILAMCAAAATEWRWDTMALESPFQVGTWASQS